jgi:outer membrane protein OmpA-like peptidoglycan-associated protein/tetratricopeptide (TPR) repeat protein
LNIYMKKISFFILLSGILSFSFAQKLKPSDFGIKSKKALKYYLEGQQQERYRAREQAIKAYAAATEIEPFFASAHFRQGLNLLILEDFEQAARHMALADSLKPNTFGGINFHLGQAYFQIAAYDKAAPRYQAYLAGGKGGPAYVQTAEVNLRKALFAREAIKRPVAFQPRNLGEDINSEEDDTMPYLTADDQTLLFMSRRSSSTGGYSPRLRGYPEDFFVATRKDSHWQPAQNLGPPINTERNEGGPCLSQDGRTLFFTGCNWEEGFGNCDLYISQKEGDRWSEPENLGPAVNSEYWDSQPCLSHNGRFLFFASNRPGGEGGRDIWYCKKENGRWTPARNLGEPVNTAGNEDAPFLHADGVSLYFASDYHNGFGGKDLFVSYAYGDWQWGEPQNLGYPVNTVGEEGYIFVNAKGSQAYMGSVREEGMGKNDLYEFKLDESIQPQRATFLRGLTRDSITHAPVQALIHLVDIEKGDTIRSLRSGRGDGRFLMSLPLDRQYAAFVQAPRYLFASKSFFLKNLDESTYFDLTIDLKPVQTGKRVRLDNVFFEFESYELKSESEPELRVLAMFLERNPRLRIEIQGHTDDVGADDFNQKLSQQRAESVRNYLIEQGIERARIEAKGYGESQPVAPNSSPEGRAQNRRTEFKVL